MPPIRLLKEPGFIYDLIFVFYLNFNKELCINTLANHEKQSENAQFFNDILNQFSDIPEDLFVFFHALDNGRCFFSTYYFNPYQELFTTTYNFRFLLNELSDKNKLIRSLIHFYLHDLSEEDLEKCVQSNVVLFSHIKESKYTSEEKSKLYEFFIHSEPYLQTLQYELMAKEVILSQYYEKNYQKILEVYNQTTFEILKEQMKRLTNLSYFENDHDKFCTSFCLINKYCINLICIREGALYLLGYEYFIVLNLAKGKKNLSLQDFGNALNEESRVKILQLLLEQPEVTCKDLEKQFNFSGSTAYHHITMMVRVGVIKTRNEGKTILYSLNRTYFDAIIGVLSRFSSRPRGGDQ